MNSRFRTGALRQARPPRIVYLLTLDAVFRQVADLVHYSWSSLAHCHLAINLNAEISIVTNPRLLSGLRFHLFENLFGFFALRKFRILGQLKCFFQLLFR
jgi:hypothetical protein